MADLYEFPYFEGRENVVNRVKMLLGLDVLIIRALNKVTHTFTRFKAELQPFVCETAKAKRVEGYEWVLKNQLRELPFSAGHKRLL